MLFKGEDFLKKILIIILIAILILSIIFIIFNRKNQSGHITSEVNQTDDIKTMIDDSDILIIVDIHENLNSYIDKEVEITGKLYEFTDGFSIGKEYILENQPFLFDIPIDSSSINKLTNINHNDSVIVSGKINKYPESHDGHIHYAPRIKISSIKKVK